MTDQTGGPSGLTDETKHSTTVTGRNGARAMLTRGNGVNFLTVQHQGVTLNAILDDDQLRALVVGRSRCCAVCAHARRTNLGSTRCHQRLRTSGGNVYAPRIENPKEHVCGKFEQLVIPAAREVAA